MEEETQKPAGGSRTSIYIWAAIIIVVIVLLVLGFGGRGGTDTNEVSQPEDTEEQIDPPSLELDTGPSDDATEDPIRTDDSSSEEPTSNGTSEGDKEDDAGTGEEDTGVESVVPELSEVVVLTYTRSGFNPKTITVEKGTTVEFRNEDDGSMWVASVVHPTHKVYPGSDIQKCFDGSDTSVLFDSCQIVETYSFTFDEVGKWRYHNHRKASHSGEIIVE